LKRLICTALLTLLVTGCSGGTEKSLAVKGDPLEWCAEHDHLPIYPAAKGDKIQKEPEVCAIIAPDDLATVSIWYEQAYAKDGWKVFKERETAQPPDAPAQLYLVEKGDAQVTMVLVQSPRDKSTSVAFSPATAKILHDRFEAVGGGKAGTAK